MTRSKPYLATAAIALLGFAMPPLAVAQEVVQPLPGTTDADKLADTMRRLGRDPRDVEALVRAGELSIGLGDLSGAAALFARAEKLDPRNGRMKAGMASILVRSERPGEALRYFAQAESYGLSPRAFAADRGFAYDLIGQQDRAQRDYRVALRDAPDDETIRRYALSLGISGRQELALQQLAPLIRKTDRGAWRARAFILAMTGDVPGASYIATTMMPAGMAQGLQPFFQRLPTLAAADRAFAVHFGEVHASAERIADARMTPPLPVLGPDASAPVMVAATPTPPVQVASTDTARGRRDRTDRRERRQPQTRVTAGRTAMAEPVPTVASPVRTAATPATQIAAATTPMVQPVPQAQVTASPAPARVQSQVAQAPVPVPTTIAPSIVAQVMPTPQRLVPAATAASVASAGAAPTGTLPSTVVAQMSALPASPAALLAARPTTTPLVTRAGSTVVAAAPTTPLPAPGFSTPVTTPAVAAPTTTPAAAAPVTTPAVTAAIAPAEAPPARVAAAREDSILARIVAGLSIPASELDVAPAAAAPIATVAAMSPDAQRVLAEAKAKTARDAAAKKVLDETLAAERAADRKAAARKAAADKKALAEKKVAAEKKAIADKEAAEEKRIARANPERIWVQVSTGATEGDLPKAWKGAKAKAPAAFGSRGGWTTPWRATNRVLAGPFKTDAEARTFVNQLAKEGVSTFSFTSDAGQVITRLPSK